MTKLKDWFYNNNSWSHTKYELWHRCKRKFWYQNIAPYLLDPGNLDVGKISMLKSLTPKYALQGRIIHEILEDQMNKHNLGREPDQEAMISQYLKKVQMYENTSRTTIAEFYNGAPDETFFDQIRETGVTQIHTFFSDLWPHIKGNIYIRHETFDKVLVDSTKVLLKVDYISQDPGGILIITDWKTGAEMEDSPINRLQMGVYVLWASEYFQKDPRDIRSELNFLSTGSIHPYLFTDTDLDDIRALITDEFRIMNSTYEYEKFPRNPSSNHCIDCAFKAICDQG